MQERSEYNLFCFTKEGGIPLFSRLADQSMQAELSYFGVLNGIQIFNENHDVETIACEKGNYRIRWKSYLNRITMILCAKSNIKSINLIQYEERLLDLCFNSLILLFGQGEIEGLKSGANIEVFKKDVKLAFNLFDILLGRGSYHLLSSVCNAVDVGYCDSSILQDHLNAWAEGAKSPYGSIILKGCTIVTTDKWWKLSTLELTLINHFLLSSPASHCRDFPIFLPHSSPTVPHRLVTFELLKDIEVCLICGPSPSLLELQSMVERFWRAVYKPLRSCCLKEFIPITEKCASERNIMGYLF
ncbi:DgyrCDS10707 [Dimorphilus gyrociliatus]|uniref:DgyrCDS10707 n=1 Tax=Dimorphilus gyrociliatus TaxID=2664684 RepID=A0A7I8W122_9ANNE|nr:DgyrCDS10707 [Dimorphilus gyrociliatus]